jgi:hypothetical protein
MVPNRQAMAGAKYLKLAKAQAKPLDEAESLGQPSTTHVFFFWSEYRDVLTQERADPLEYDKQKFRQVMPENLIVVMGPIFRRRCDVASLYVDDCHYSKEGHRVAGQYLAEFIAERSGVSGSSDK